jgi:hypothetical protein
VYNPQGIQTIVFQNVKEIALYTLIFYKKRRKYIQRTVYFHLKEGFERMYQNTEQWNTDDSYCICLPLVGLAISDLEIYSKIKELSGLTEVIFPE